MSLSFSSRSTVRDRPSFVLLEGSYQPHPKGFGFVVTDDGGPDVFIPPGKNAHALPGERVRVRAGEVDAKGRRSGSVATVLSIEFPSIMGRVGQHEGQSAVLALNPAWPPIVLETSLNLEAESLVLCAITGRATATSPVKGVVKTVMESRWTAESVWAAAAHRHGVATEFPQAVLEEASAVEEALKPDDLLGRVDLRSLPLVTIDGPASHDFDDAVFAESLPEGRFRMVVAIADVSHYVTPGLPMDEEALDRATSIYVPGRVLPMLPEHLSNGVCSLNPNVDRLCLVCDAEIEPDGTLGVASFYTAVMHSHARLTYDEVAGFFEGAALLTSESVKTSLLALHDLYRVFANARAVRGALDFDAPEVMVALDDHERVSDLQLRQRNDAHRLVEECMVAANVLAARWLLEHGEPGPFRNHETPGLHRYMGFSDYLQHHGVIAPAHGDLSVPHLSELMASLKSHPHASGMEMALFKTQGKALYQPENSGHFGLGLAAYAHFTSPIRRYPDVLVHRAIKRTLLGDHQPFDAAMMADLTKSCSEREKRATAIERETVDRHRCAWLASQVGAEFEGVVGGIAEFGAFVLLNASCASALLPLSAFPEDAYVYDAGRQAFKGARHSVVLGQSVRVRLVEACPDRLRLTLAWVREGT